MSRITNNDLAGAAVRHTRILQSPFRMLLSHVVAIGAGLQRAISE